MEIVLIGLNHRTASVELRERVAFSAEQAREAAEQLRSRGILEETLVLSTCNRSELYGVPRELSTDSAGAVELFLASFHQTFSQRIGWLALPASRQPRRAASVPRRGGARFHAAGRSGNSGPGARRLPDRARPRRNRARAQPHVPGRAGSGQARSHRKRRSARGPFRWRLRE